MFPPDAARRRISLDIPRLRNQSIRAKSTISGEAAGEMRLITLVSESKFITAMVILPALLVILTVVQ